MSEKNNPMNMGELIDTLNSYNLDSPLKIRVNDENAKYANDVNVHAFGGDHYEMAFICTTGAKHGEIAVVRELMEKLEDYSHSSMDDYGGNYWHDSESLIFYADYSEKTNLQPVSVEQNQHGVVTIIIQKV